MKFYARHLCALWVLLFPLFTLAQAPKVTWGDGVNSHKASSGQGGNRHLYKIIGETPDGVYFLTMTMATGSTGAGQGGELYYLQRAAGPSLAGDYSEVLILPTVNGRKTEFEQAAIVGNQVVIFGHSYDKKTDMMTSVAFRANAECKIDTNYVVLGTYTSIKRKEIGSFMYVVAEDRSSFASVYASYNKSLKQTELDIHILNGELKVLREIKDVFTNKEFDPSLSFTSFLMDADMTFHAYAEYEKGMGMTKHFNVFSYYPEDNWTRKIHDLRKTGTKQVDLVISERMGVPVMVLDPTTHDVTVAGLYGMRRAETMGGLSSMSGGSSASNASSDVLLEGIYYFRIGRKDKAISVANMESFDWEFHANFFSQNAAKMNGAKVEHTFFPLDVFSRPDGGIYLVCEYNKAENFSYTDPYLPYAVSGTTTSYNEILVASISPAGKKDWVKVIGKKQEATVTTTMVAVPLGVARTGKQLYPVVATGSFVQGVDNYTFCSAITCCNKGKIYVLFNSDPKMADVTSPRDMKTDKTPSSGVPVMVTIDATGAMTKSGIEGAADADADLCTNTSFSCSPDRIIIYGTHQKIDKIGILGF